MTAPTLAVPPDSDADFVNVAMVSPMLDTKTAPRADSTTLEIAKVGAGDTAIDSRWWLLHYLEDDSPIYRLEDIAERLGVSPAEAEKAMHKMLTERESLGLSTDGIVTDAALIRRRR